MLSLDEELFADFCTFSRAHLWSWDIDPMYPWLKQVFDAADLDERTRLWRLYCYVAYYHVGSTIAMWDWYPDPPDAIDDELDLPTGTERRCFRGQGHLAKKNLTAALDTDLFEPTLWNTLDGEDGWQTARDQFESVPWNGPWASYKWADLLKHVMGYSITANDIGVGGNSKTAGPIPGMVKLTGRDWKECALNTELQHELLDACRDAGVPFNGLDQLETCLCDFNSAIKGHYYVGHDIDQYGAQLHEMTERGLPTDDHWTAREAVFPDMFRGEASGWRGVRKPHQSLYATHGILDWWAHDDRVPSDPDITPRPDLTNDLHVNVEATQ